MTFPAESANIKRTLTAESPNTRTIFRLGFPQYT